MQDLATLDSLTSEFLELHRHGAQPSVTDFADRYPHLAEEIRELFPAALAMEKLKRRHQRGRVMPDGGIQWDSKIIHQLGDFRIKHEIGRGGMGIVYLAEQQSLGRDVALKILRHSGILDSSGARRFHREAQAAARLHHTNIVPVFGFGHHEGVHYYVMQWIDGVSVDRVLSERCSGIAPESTRPNSRTIAFPVDDTPPLLRVAQLLIDGSAPGGGEESSARNNDTDARCETSGARLDWSFIANIGRQVADGLQYAHSQSILHRDIKPGNLILDRNGTVWVTDFGLAKLVEHDEVTRSGDIVGTLRYMAPEQFEGQCDARSDIYSLGLTLYELATLRPAFDQTDRPQLVERILNGEPPRPRKLNREIPADLETIILKAIARDPAHRYAHANELFGDLTCFLEDRPVRARRVGPIERFWRWCRRNPSLAMATSTAMFLLVLATAVASISYANIRTALTGRDHQYARAEQQRQLAEDNLRDARVERRRAESSYRRAESERRRAENNLGQAESERNRAEANLQLSLEAFEEVFSRIAPERFIQTTDPDAEEDQFESQHSWVISKRDAALLHSMLRFYDQFTRQNEHDSNLCAEAAKAYRRVGDIQQRLGEFAEAENAYGRALGIYQQLAGTCTPDDPMLTSLAAVYNDLGQVLEMTGQLGAAQQHHHQALETLRGQLERAPDSTTINLELVRTYNFLGYAIWGRCRERGNKTPRLVTRAEINHRKAIEVVEKLIATDPMNPDYQLVLARSYRDLSPVLYCRDRKRDAVESMDRAVEILEELVTNYPAVPAYRYELMRIYSRRESWIWGLGGNDEGESRYSRAINLAQELVTQFPTVAEYSARHADAHYRLASLLRRMDRECEAEDMLLTAVHLLHKQVGRFPTIPHHRLYLAMAQDSLSEIYEETSRPSEARILLEDSMATMLDLCEELEFNGSRQFAQRCYERQQRKLDKMPAIHIVTPPE